MDIPDADVGSVTARIGSTRRLSDLDAGLAVQVRDADADSTISVDGHRDGGGVAGSEQANAGIPFTVDLQRHPRATSVVVQMNYDVSTRPSVAAKAGKIRALRTVLIDEHEALRLNDVCDDLFRSLFPPFLGHGSSHWPVVDVLGQPFGHGLLELRIELRTFALKLRPVPCLPL
ncbi:MAG: hypothetical protein KY476_17180 [Planctomycetes bacterium]|nr:hypothetical protein [Planctomycetota bacterium]